jgi:hypothetical protein
MLGGIQVFWLIRIAGVGAAGRGVALCELQRWVAHVYRAERTVIFRLVSSSPADGLFNRSSVRFLQAVVSSSLRWKKSAPRSMEFLNLGDDARQVLGASVGRIEMEGYNCVSLVCHDDFNRGMCEW